jgi:L-alanine-DL-glutamate epimerase-like enolase superfamily enzyme
MVIPHGHSTPAGLHFTLAQSPALTPYQEYLVKWNAINQFFLTDRLEPLNGVLAQPTSPGLGMDLDEARIEASVELEV